MKSKTFFVLIILVFIIYCFVHQNNSNSHTRQNNINQNLNSTYSTLPGTYNNSSNRLLNSNYKYQYRTGNSGNYELSYDVSGEDENGNSVGGSVEMSGRYGSGTLQNDEGEDIDIDAEWVDYGEMEATDNEGNTYSLDVD